MVFINGGAAFLGRLDIQNAVTVKHAAADLPLEIRVSLNFLNEYRLRSCPCALALA
jgi:hypothetical protein